MSNNQEHTNTDNMENQTQQALEKDSAQLPLSPAATVSTITSGKLISP